MNKNESNGKRHTSPQSLNAAVKTICDIMRRCNCAGALQYVPEVPWILFLRILDEREAHEAEEAEALGLRYKASIPKPYRWRDWAAPDSPLRQDKNASMWKFVHEDLLPKLKGLEKQPGAAARQKVISEIMAGVDRSRIDSEKNFLDVLDKVHEIRSDTVDDTHVFTLSQVYERLLLKMGEQGNDGGQFFTPRALANLVLHGIDEPHIWHGNSLSGVAAYDGLFQGAPQFYDVVWMNPPFGGKEGKEAQTPYDFKTGATQVLFLRNLLKSMKAGSHCGIVLDEGVLFRVDGAAFVKTKRKLLEECEVYCLVSLPGGGFSSAGAGVKTNLVFCKKGKPTERIWYFDLADVKVGKKSPITLRNFEEFFNLLPKRGNSERSWTVDFAARQQKALEEARPNHANAAGLTAQAKTLNDAIREKKKAKNPDKAALATIEEKAKALDREAREAQAKADSIEDGAFDLKAVNPNRVSQEDKRTPQELLAFIAEKGREADASLQRLTHLVTESR